MICGLRKGSNRDTGSTLCSIKWVTTPKIYATELSLRFYKTLLSDRLPFEVKGHMASTSHAKCIYSKGLVTSPM